jgi:hypothetical protein
VPVSVMPYRTPGVGPVFNLNTFLHIACSFYTLLIPVFARCMADEYLHVVCFKGMLDELCMAVFIKWTIVFAYDL